MFANCEHNWESANRVQYRVLQKWCVTQPNNITPFHSNLISNRFMHFAVSCPLLRCERKRFIRCLTLLLVNLISHTSTKRISSAQFCIAYNILSNVILLLQVMSYLIRVTVNVCVVCVALSVLILSPRIYDMCVNFKAFPNLHYLCAFFMNPSELSFIWRFIENV